MVTAARPLVLAVLVSGEGTTLEGIAERIEAGRLAARIGLVIADRPGTPALARARAHGLATREILRSGRGEADWSRDVREALTTGGAELVVLAGFLAILPPSLLESWKGRVINLHPALLPKYGGRGMYGRRVHEAVLRAGERETGVSVHLVIEAVDAGPVLTQVRVPVRPDDTPTSLRERMHPVEVEALAATIAAFARGDWPLPYPSAEAG